MHDGRKHWARRETNRNLARERGLGVVGTRVVRPRTTATYGCDAETPPRRNACRRPHKITGPGVRKGEREKNGTLAEERVEQRAGDDADEQPDHRERRDREQRRDGLAEPKRDNRHT
jgi:hypothetical protein